METISFRAKMFVTNVNKYGTEEQPIAQVKMSAVYEYMEGVEGNAAEENKIFGQWTPNASFDMTVYNPNVIDQLELGKNFYVDFTPAE